jgi:hypothetical protein
VNSARTDIEQRCQATSLVVQEHLVLASRLRLIESLEEINATLRFYARVGQESVQSRVIDGDVTILRPKALGQPINAGDRNVTLIFNANHSHRNHDIHLSLVAQVGNQFVFLRVLECLLERR